MIASINPANGQVLRTFEPLTDSQIEEKLAARNGCLPAVSPDLVCGPGTVADARGRDSGI